jgi:hypothetical protein
MEADTGNYLADYIALNLRNTGDQFWYKIKQNVTGKKAITGTPLVRYVIHTA